MPQHCMLVKRRAILRIVALGASYTCVVALCTNTGVWVLCRPTLLLDCIVGRKGNCKYFARKEKVARQTAAQWRLYPEQGAGL